MSVRAPGRASAPVRSLTRFHSPTLLSLLEKNCAPSQVNATAKFRWPWAQKPVSSSACSTLPLMTSATFQPSYVPCRARSPRRPATGALRRGPVSGKLALVCRHGRVRSRESEPCWRKRGAERMPPAQRRSSRLAAFAHLRAGTPKPLHPTRALPRPWRELTAHIDRHGVMGPSPRAEPLGVRARRFVPNSNFKGKMGRWRRPGPRSGSNATRQVGGIANRGAHRMCACSRATPGEVLLGSARTLGPVQLAAAARPSHGSSTSGAPTLHARARQRLHDHAWGVAHNVAV